MISSFISVAIGGALGAICRYSLSLYATSSTFGLPAWMATLAVNVMGCALMGFFSALIASAPHISTGVRPLIMVGFLGALTTFSSFALDSFQLLETQQYGVLMGYLASSFLLSLGAFFISYHFGKLLIG